MTTGIPDNADLLLRRKQAAEALNVRGFPVKASTLATWCTRGGGPPYRHFGRIALYRLGDLIQWAEGRLTAPRCNTAEADAAGHPRTQVSRGMPERAIATD